MATIAFVQPPEDKAGLLSANPTQLTRWIKLSRPEPKYDQIYVVQIEDANPARLRVSVKKLPVGAVQAQAELKASHLADANDCTRIDVSANTGRNLDLTFSSKTGALVIFHLTDANATFVPEVLDSVVKNAKDTDEILFNAEWIEGSDKDHKAVSVIMTGGDEGKKKLDYGLGVRLKNDDPYGPGYTTIIIDPKVENEGTR